MSILKLCVFVKRVEQINSVVSFCKGVSVFLNLILSHSLIFFEFRRHSILTDKMKLFLFLISCTLIYTVTALDETNGACAELGEGFHLKPNTGCKTYYSCVAGGTGMEYDCPDGYLFNDEEKVCAREGTFECDSGPLPVCPAEGVEQIPIPGTGCQKFFLCIDGTPIERECAEGIKVTFSCDTHVF